VQGQYRLPISNSKVQSFTLDLEIGNKCHTDLDGEARIRSCISNVANSDEVDAETNNMAVYSGDDREGRTFRCPDGFLESKKGLARLK